MAIWPVTTTRSHQTSPSRTRHSWSRRSTPRNSATGRDVYVQARAGHAQATMTERYVHAARVALPAERAEARLSAGVADASRLGSTETASMEVRQ
jgi:integrase